MSLCFPASLCLPLYPPSTANSSRSAPHRRSLSYDDSTYDFSTLWKWYPFSGNDTSLLFKQRMKVLEYFSGSSAVLKCGLWTLCYLSMTGGKQSEKNKHLNTFKQSDVVTTKYVIIYRVIHFSSILQTCFPSISQECWWNKETSLSPQNVEEQSAGKVFLSQEWLCLPCPGELWRHFLLPHWGQGCYWHLVCRGQGCC